MKTLGKYLMLLTAFCALSVTSCVNDDLAERQDLGAGKIAALEEQAAAVEVSVKELKDLQNLLEANAVEMNDDIVASLEQHAEILRNGALSLGEGTSATFQLQKQLGAIVGTALAELDTDNNADKLMRSLNSLEKSISNWVGENFNMLYSVTVAQTRVKASVEKFGSQLNNQKIYVDALMSDVEAGFRKDEKPEELKSLAASVQELIVNSSKLAEGLTVLASDVEKEYESAVASVLSEPAGFDGAALKELNANAAVELAEADNSLAGLSTRVAACESQLASIIERLGELETEIEDLEKLLGMIQSVTLMTEYSAEEAVAKYNMSPNKSEVTEEGYRKRTPTTDVELNYVVRPASAAAALTESSLWNNDLKVFGYYANRIEQSAVDFVNFNITDVQADALTGVVTVTIDNDFTSDFYYKKTGAKLALSISTGKTDLTSKFVEVVPKDASGTVYLESLTLPVDYVEIDDGQSYQLNAKITPANVTDAEVTWTTSNVDVVAVSGTGKLDAKAVGNVVITVTSNSTDEWGRQLSATCNVKVTPNIKLNAPSYIEEGGTMEIKVESPEYIDPSLIEWSVSKWEKAGVKEELWETVASIDQNGVLTANKNTYNNLETKKSYDPIYVTCSIYGGQTVIKHELRIVVPQPKKIVISGKGDNENSHTVKIGSEYSLASTIYPDAVQNSGYFGIIYQSSYPEVASIEFNSGLVKAHAPGTASMTITARSANTGRYAYPSGTEWKRYFDIIVEPYWVETISLPETLTLAPEATATLTPVFTSDVDGNPPTYTSVTWTSSDPNVVSVDEKTGELTAITVGSARITATTVDGATSDSNPKSASCVVTVKVPVAEVKVGDYYYSDGTWGSDPNPSGKSVIGVIFSDANAVAADPLLLRDYPNCSNGLAIGLYESSSAFGNYRIDGEYSNSLYNGTYGIESYGAVLSDNAPTGYGLTLAYGNYRENIKSSSGYENSCILFDNSSGVAANYNRQTSTPSSASAWYIPSKYEMDSIYKNKGVINAALNSVSGTQIGNERYWSSYVYSKKLHGDSTHHDCYAYPIDMSNGSWITNAANTTSYKVRVVLAF